jgi:hypothetical protein
MFDIRPDQLSMSLDQLTPGGKVDRKVLLGHEPAIQRESVNADRQSGAWSLTSLT